MAYAGKFVSSKTIIAKIARTFKPNSSSWINEAIEDLGWAIPAIGYHAGFENKQTLPPYLKVKHNRTKIPCDVERIIAVEKLLPDVRKENILNPDGTTPTIEFDNNCNYKGVRLSLGSDLTGYGLAQDSVRTTNVTPAADYYNLNTDYVVTSFTDGLIKLHYIGYATDKDNFPKIVDDPDYKMALEWYLFSQMILKGYKHPEIGFKEAFELWEVYRLRAENAMKGLTLDSAERFRNTWNRFATNNEYAGDFFMNAEQAQYIDK
jgi:hypothetical protein